MAVITEYIEFNKFNSKDLGLFLKDRDAPTPESKDIIMDLPLMQGVLDFSMIMGERTFTNREITYEFTAPKLNYGQRKKLERTIKQLVMMHGISTLLDTHDVEYYWIGKCVRVEVIDDHEFNRLLVVIVFDCYPFMYSKYRYFDDVWDTFNFEEQASCFIKYDVKGFKDILLINVGSTTVSPVIISSSPIKIEKDGEVFSFNAGSSEDFVLALQPGENKLKVVGDAIVSFHYSYEVMG